MNVVHVKHRQLLKTCLVIGAGLLVLLYFRSRARPQQRTSSAELEGIFPRPQGALDGHHWPGGAVHSRGRKHAEIRTGLETRDGRFIINGQKLYLLSGAMHYFRVVPGYWKDRMLKMKAAGLNTLETYVAWNGHEPQKGVYNFDGLYNIRKYIEVAQEVGLYVIVRPGPYICAEWDLGGLPSWLLRDPEVELRSTYKPYIDAVRSYIKRLAQEIGHLQYRYGGPIIAFQVENEFGVYGRNKHYLRTLQEIFLKNDLKELHFTSDNARGIEFGSLAGALATANFNKVVSGEALLEFLRKRQPDMPLMVMEFWPGWFDHWGLRHKTMQTPVMAEVLKFILQEAGSVNFYMFHGGTNFGFMSGANMPYSPQSTSYDYDAPISEYGFMTEKYHKVRQMLAEFSKVTLPELPPQPQPVSYDVIKMASYMKLDTILNHIKPVLSDGLVPMEMLDINNGSGQGHGFIMYRKVVPKAGHVQVISVIRDRLQVIVNGKQLGVFDWKADNPTVDVSEATQPKEMEMIIDLLVENLGRVNYGHYKSGILDKQKKGLKGELQTDGHTVQQFQIYPLEFKPDFVEKILHDKLSWRLLTKTTLDRMTQPMLLRGTLSVTGTPKDTFLLLKDWTKGVVFVNNFNLGRYWNIGPQQTLYVPGPLLKEGDNEILIFELHKATDSIPTVNLPVLDSVVS